MSPDVTQGEVLSSKQEKALSALLVSTSIDEAAKKTGVSGRTLLRWLAEPEFEAAYRQARKEATQQAICMLQRSSAGAVAVLLKIASDNLAPASARVKAAMAILEYAFRGVEIDDMLARLEELEQKFGEQKPK